MTRRRTTAFQRMMDEPIEFPGFPEVVTTRGFAYKWLADRGWSKSERGFDSLDYTVFRPTTTSRECTEPEQRDQLLRLLEAKYRRKLVKIH